MELFFSIEHQELPSRESFFDMVYMYIPNLLDSNQYHEISRYSRKSVLTYLLYDSSLFLGIHT